MGVPNEAETSRKELVALVHRARAFRVVHVGPLLAMATDAKAVLCRAYYVVAVWQVVPVG